MTDFYPTKELLDKIKEYGGFTNCLTYPSRAYTITSELLKSKMSMGMAFKAPTALEILKELSPENIRINTLEVVRRQLVYGCSTIALCVDLHPEIGTKVLDVMISIKEELKPQIVNIVLISHPLQTTANPKMMDLLIATVNHFDILGSALFREKDNFEKHLGFMFDLSVCFGKKLQFQTDQENDPNEIETLDLVEYIMKNNPLKSNVYIAYGTSTSSLSIEEQKILYRKMAEIGIGVVVCPSAQLATKWNQFEQGGKNSIINLPLMLEHGLTVGIGTANILDIHQPFLTGDLKREILTLAEATRYYDIENLAKIASANGRKILLG